MAVLVWSLLAAQTASSLILPHQQLVKHQRGENQQLVQHQRGENQQLVKHQRGENQHLVKHQQEIQHKEMFTSPSSHHHQTSYTFVPEQQVGHKKQTQRSFHKVVAFQHQNLHKKEELKQNRKLTKFNQDEQQRSMQLPQSLVPQQNISVTKENIQAAMVQKVIIQTGMIPGKACCSHTVQIYFWSKGSAGRKIFSVCFK